MFHQFELTLASKTPAADPITQTLQLHYGIITYMAIGFPPGCKGLAKAKVMRYEHQIFPNNTGAWAYWDGAIIGGQTHIPLVESPYILKAIGYNDDDKYDHTLSIFVIVLPVEVAEPWAEPQSLLDRIKSMLGIK